MAEVRRVPSFISELQVEIVMLVSDLLPAHGNGFYKGVEWKGKGGGLKREREKQGKGKREITSAGSSIDPAVGVSRVLGCP